MPRKQKQMENVAEKTNELSPADKLLQEDLAIQQSRANVPDRSEFDRLGFEMGAGGADGSKIEAFRLYARQCAAGVESLESAPDVLLTINRAINRRIRSKVGFDPKKLKPEVADDLEKSLLSQFRNWGHPAVVARIADLDNVIAAMNDLKAAKVKVGSEIVAFNAVLPAVKKMAEGDKLTVDFAKAVLTGDVPKTAEERLNAGHKAIQKKIDDALAFIDAMRKKADEARGNPVFASTDCDKVIAAIDAWKASQTTRAIVVRREESARVDAAYAEETAAAEAAQ